MFVSRVLMREGFRLWSIALAVATLAVAGCGDRAIAPVSASDARTPAKRATPLVNASGSPAACSIDRGSPVWTIDFPYTGSASSWNVPSWLTHVTVIAQGAQGSNALGGCERATIPVTPGERLGIFVGGQGSAGGRGGYNGGGDGGAFCCGGAPGGGGGGASDVREGGIALANRVLVGGGGGGSSGDGWSGGGGGGQRGGDGLQSSLYPRGSGGGGTQTQGGKAAAGGTDGSLGAGGKGGSKVSTGTFGGGGGGGGYFGGGGGRYSHHDGPTKLDDGDSGGGGGSGFAEAKAVDVMTAQGGRYGNGLVTIAWPQTTLQIASGLSSPIGIAVDTHGNLYVTTAENYVSRIAPNGTTTKVGTNFNQAEAVAVDTMGNVYVSDGYSQAIYKVAPPFDTSTNGTISTVVTGTQSNSLAVDGNGTLYFTDRCGDNCGAIKKLVPGRLSTLASGFYTQGSVAVDATCKANCAIYETDRDVGFFSTDWYVWKLDENGTKTPVTNISDPTPTVVATDAAGAIYIVDQPLKAVFKVPAGGVPFGVGSPGGYPTQVAVIPSCLSVCPVFVTDNQNGWVNEVR
jgi:hypothetical protein